MGHSKQYGAALSELLSEIQAVPEDMDVRVCDLRMDSRKVQKGDLFLALANTDGVQNGYINDAVSRGAIAVLVEVDMQSAKGLEIEGAVVLPFPELKHKCGQIADRFFGKPSEDLEVIGVTGTNGKTSVSHYVAQLLSANGVKTGIIGTLGVGFPGGKLKETGYTTPDVVEVHRHLACLRDLGARLAVMEVSSHGLEQGRVDSVRFSGAIFTNLTRDHLDYHGSMENYGQAKAKLFKGDSLNFVILNAEDPFAEVLQSVVPRSCQVLFYGESFHQSSEEKKIDVRLVEANYMENIELVVKEAGKLTSFPINLVGRFNALNVLAAATTLKALGISVNRIREWDSIHPVPGRMNVFTFLDGVNVVVDYAHTPDALEKVLLAVRQHCKGKLIVVFGCGGDRDSGKRPEMAKVVEQLANRITLTDDNPRGESPELIVADILSGFSSLEHVNVEHQRSIAIRQAIDSASESDWVVIAGKGHEQYQEVCGERLPYSDLEVLKEIAGNSSKMEGLSGGAANDP